MKRAKNTLNNLLILLQKNNIKPPCQSEYFTDFEAQKIFKKLNENNPDGSFFFILSSFLFSQSFIYFRSLVENLSSQIGCRVEIHKSLKYSTFSLEYALPFDNYQFLCLEKRPDKNHKPGLFFLLLLCFVFFS